MVKPGHVRDSRRNVSGADAIFGVGQVLHLVGDNAGSALQAVGFRSECATIRSYTCDSGRQVTQCRLRSGSAGQTSALMSVGVPLKPIAALDSAPVVTVMELDPPAVPSLR